MTLNCISRCWSFSQLQMTLPITRVLLLPLALLTPFLVVVLDPNEKLQTKFYEVVWTAGVGLRQTVEMDNEAVCVIPVGSVLEIVDEVPAVANGSQRVRLADGRGWVTMLAADGSVCMRECMRPFSVGAAVLPENGDTFLLLASKGGHYELLEFLFSQGAEVNRANKSRLTPLIAASEGGYARAVQLLVTAGANVNRIAASPRRTALYSACRNGHLEVAKVLLNAQADTSIPEVVGGNTPIKAAASNGHLEVVSMLLAAGADISTPNKDGWTPLNSAASNGHLEVVSMLLAAGADISTPNKDGWTPLNSAAYNGHVELVSALLAAGANISTPENDGSTPFNAAASNGHLNVVAVLLAAGADANTPNKDGWTPLNVAAYKGRSDVVSALLLARVDVLMPNKDGWAPLNSAASNGHLEVVLTLLAAGANVSTPNNDGWTPLNAAAYKGHVKVVSALLAAQANASTPENNGSTPLNNAASKGLLEVVSVLLTAGADPNMPNNSGLTPLNVAAYKGHLEVVSALLAAGADPYTPNNKGLTPLYAAVLFRHSKIVSVLLAAGADVSTPNQEGWAPLFVAAHYGDLELVQVLLAAGADACAPNGEGLTPLFEAASRGKLEAVTVLLAADADVRTTLNLAAHNSSWKSVAVLLRRKDRKCPVHSSLWGGVLTDEELAQIISQHHLTVCDVDCMGYTAYQVAVEQQCSYRIIEAILRHAALLSLRQFESPVKVKSLKGHTRFSLNVPVARARVYYEVTATNRNFSIGFASRDWCPGAASDVVVICINKQRICCCQDQMFVVTLPECTSSSVVGVSIDSTQQPSATIQFFFDGVPIDMPELPKLFELDTEVVAFFEVDDEKQELALNFGESDLRFKPQGFSSLFEFAKNDFRRAIHVWNKDKASWEATIVKTGVLAQYFDDWPRVVSEEGNEGLVQTVLSHHANLAEELCHVRDISGRRAIDGASLSCRKVMNKFMHFVGRYEFFSKIPKHKSNTCMLYLAKDLETGEAVAVKLMNSEPSFRLELESRAKVAPENAYVISVIRSFNGDEDDEFRLELQCKGFGAYNYCIIMPAAQRNLHQILSQENVAGKDWACIRRMVDDILQCVAHLHDRDLIHGDLKPLNIMRDRKGKMVLIDLDASRECGTAQIVGRKFSSAFCPPEAVDFDMVTGNVFVKFSSPQSPGAAAATAVALLSQASFDMWALGATVYEMCAGEPLFLSSYDNMLDSTALHLLRDWDDSVKGEKLEKIADPKARNMVSRLLCKDPQQRMSIAAALVHPFVTGSAPVRMVGDAAKYDVFISYRVASDSENVQILYEKLTADGLTVFWDKLCLPDGVPWEEGFCDGLVQSKVFVCLISREAVGHAINPRQSFSQLNTTSACDNVLLEHQLALELRAMGLIEFIYPVFIGEKKSDGSHAPFDWGCYGALPDVVVASVLEKLTGHLSRQALGVPLDTSRTVKKVIGEVNSNQGIKVEGDGDAAFEVARSKIVGLCRPAVVAAIGKRASTPRSSLVARLEAEKVQLQTEKQQLQSEKDRAEAASLTMRRQMEAEIAALRTQLGHTEKSSHSSQTRGATS